MNDNELKTVNFDGLEYKIEGIEIFLKRLQKRDFAPLCANLDSTYTYVLNQIALHYAYKTLKTLAFNFVIDSLVFFLAKTLSC